MKYLKNPETGEVFAFESDDSQDAFIPPGLELMTEEQVHLHLNPPPVPLTPPELFALVDQERDRRIDSDIEFQGVAFQNGVSDRENIAGAAQLAFMAVVAGAQPGDLRWSQPGSDFVWVASDNRLVPMDAHTVGAFGKAAAERKQALILAGRQLKDMAQIPTDYSDDKWWP